LALLISEFARQAILEAFAKFDRLEDPTTKDAYELADGLMSVISPDTNLDPYRQYWNLVKRQSANSPRIYRFVAVNLQRFNEIQTVNRRVELRAVRPQASMDVFVRQVRLLRNRLRYLSTLNTPVPLQLPAGLTEPVPYETQATTEQALNPPINAQDALRNFRKFVEESGERIEDHLDYVWPQWISTGEVHRFLCDSKLREGPP
jgi:hypothetical protein